MTSREGRTRAPRMPPAERVKDIVVAARQLALEQGLTALTLRSVASRAGVAHGLIVHYVSSMDALIAQTYSTIASTEIGEIHEILSSLRTPRSRIAALITTLLDGTRDDTTTIWVEGWALGRRNETLAVAVREQSDAWQAVFSGVIEEGVIAGDFATDDPAAVAWQLLGMIDGLNAQALVRRGHETHRGSLVCGVAEGMLGLERGDLSAALERRDLPGGQSR